MSASRTYELSRANSDGGEPSPWEAVAMLRTVAVVIALTVSACGGHVAQPAELPFAASTTTPTPPPVASATTSSGIAPASAGVVPEAGVLYVRGADDGIYRYEGATGALTRVWAGSTFELETTAGTYVVGRHGGATLLRWNGTTAKLPCGMGSNVSVAANGACASAASAGPYGAYVKLPGGSDAREILPASWGAAAPSWSPDGSRLLLVRQLARRPKGPGTDPGLSALWLMEPTGELHEIYRPAPRGVLVEPRWSPDGVRSLVRQIETTSESMAADGAGITTILIDVATGKSTPLGTVMNDWWAWGPAGQLALVRGAGRYSWSNKELLVRGPDGSEQVVDPMGGARRVALAPAWGPQGQLAWVSGPTSADGDGGGYIDGRGAGRRVGMIEDHGQREQVACRDGRVVEGIRWSADGAKLLLLCREPGNAGLPLELWLHRLADGTSVPLVRGLLSHPQSGGFGYYGAQPSLFAVAAWSLAGR